MSDTSEDQPRCICWCGPGYRRLDRACPVHGDEADARRRVNAAAVRGAMAADVPSERVPGGPPLDELLIPRSVERGSLVDPSEVLPDDVWIPSVDVCAHCTDVYCDGVACIADLDPDSGDDNEALNDLHDLIRLGQAWRIMERHGADVARAALRRAGHWAADTSTNPTSTNEET